jgi:hypothetical protein
MDCLENIIGLSQTTCECLTDSLPEGSDEGIDANTSESGVWLDELDGFNMNIVDGAASCAAGSVWDIMNKARSGAIQDFKNDLLACVGASYKPRLENFHWQLGESSFKGTLNNVVGPYAGMRISPLQIKGGYIYIKRIGILINESTSVTVQIWSNENDGTLIFTSTPINTTADTLTWATLATPQALPMWSHNTEHIRYYVVMQMSGTFRPKSNKKDCGCSSKAKPYDKWLELTGVEGSDTSDMNGFRVNSTYLNGVVVDVDLKCKSAEFICSDEYPLDFENDGESLNKAIAIRFRAGARCYEKILSSDEINRQTMMKRDELRAYVDKWNAEYVNWIKYLCENVNIDVNDCLVCRVNKTSLIKSTILR